MEVVAVGSMKTQRQETWACSVTESFLLLVGKNLACLLLVAESLLIGLVAVDQRLSVKEGYKRGSRIEENKDANLKRMLCVGLSSVGKLILSSSY
ncbi:unnamed protein product [Arabidopsis thaliana]|uniref:(thale cress) hypothetical protein n=1 Tax=Arabidopsis thaliana TaxID=3702 RepID=A0A7G2E836_ARATH|nr:unnamed protein product [Arabidopsis thaliana]